MLQDSYGWLNGFGMTPGGSGAGGRPGDGSSGAEGAGGSALPTLQPGQITVKDGLAILGKSFRDLVDLSIRIDQTYGMAGLGRRVPCYVVDLYNSGVRAYIKGAQATFKQILALDPKFDILQTGYDSHGTVVTQERGPVPMMPPSIIQPECGRAPMMTSTGLAALPAIPWLAYALFAVIAGTTIVVTAHVIWGRDPVSVGEAVDAIKARLDALLSCVTTRREDLKAAGVPASQAEIDAFCMEGVGPRPQLPPVPTSDSNWPVWVGVGAGVVIGSLVLLKYLGGRDA